MKPEIFFLLRGKAPVYTVFLAVLFVVISTAVQCQFVETSFIINGTTDLKNDRTVFISYYSSIKGKGITDSCKVKDGQFSFKGQLAEPSVASFAFTNSRNVADLFMVFIEPASMEIKVSDNPLKVEVLSGSATQVEYDTLTAMQNKLKLKYKNAIEQSKRLDIVSEEIKSELNAFYAEMRKVEFDFFLKHPQSFVTGRLLQSHFGKLSVDSLQLFYDNMGDRLQQSIYGANLKEAIIRKMPTLTGKKVVDFLSTTVKNEAIRLSDFRGKHVLLDFWAHWCVPCRKSFPKVIQWYKQYHSKGLEVIGVASDDFARDDWRAAIKKDGVNIWYNILAGTKKNEKGEIDLSESISRKYDVHLLPTKVLINREGIIIGRYIGSDTDANLEKKLADIFN